MTAIQPYLFFSGRCDEALEFYKHALGAKLNMLMRFSESPDPVPAGMLAPGFEQKVMHAQFTVAGSAIMASDGCQPGGAFSGFSLSLTLPTAADVQRAFDKLADGGEISMPVGKTFWSPCFGMVKDRFGVQWMLSVPE